MITHLGFTEIDSFALDGGMAIDLRRCISNDDLGDLLRLSVVELIAAFDITGKEWAEQDRLALAQAIHSGYSSAKQPSL